LKQQGGQPAELINGRSGDLVLVSPYHLDTPAEALFKAFLGKIRTDRAPDNVIDAQQVGLTAE
jgi:hypothetical protein